MSIGCRLFCVLGLMLMTLPALWADGPPDCKNEKEAKVGIFGGGNKACTKKIPVSTEKPINQPVKPVQVPNKSEVTVQVHKRPIDDCDVKVTSSPAPPETSPIATIFSILSPIGIKTALMAKKTTPSDKAALKIEGDIDKLESLLSLPTQVMNFTACKDQNNNDICPAGDDGKAFTRAKEILETNLDNLMAPGLNLDSMMTNIESELGQFAKEYPTVDKDWQEEAWGRLKADKLKIPELQKAMDSLLQFRASLKSYKIEVVTRTQFPSNLQNVVFTGTVTCTNHFTKQPFGSGASLTVTFKNTLPFSGSAGVIISPLSKRPIGIVESQSKNAQGATTFTTAIGYTSHSTAQFIPSGFANLALYGISKLSLNLSVGVGLNPNNGSNQVEYVFGPSLQTHKVYFGMGAHVTRFPSLGNGFYVGEPVQGVSASNLPISYGSTVHLGFFVSYQPSAPSK